MSKDKVISADDLFHVVFDRASGKGLAGCSSAEFEIRKKAMEEGFVTAREVYEGVRPSYREWLWGRTVGRYPRNYGRRREELREKFLKKHSGDWSYSLSCDPVYNKAHAEKLMPWGSVVKAFFTELKDC